MHFGMVKRSTFKQYDAGIVCLSVCVLVCACVCVCVLACVCEGAWGLYSWLSVVGQQCFNVVEMYFSSGGTLPTKYRDILSNIQ